MKNQTLNIRISEKLKADLKKLASDENKSVTEYITDLIKKELSKKEIKEEEK